jgi:formylglycine-generating enzyme required for sulfatase activity
MHFFRYSLAGLIVLTLTLKLAHAQESPISIGAFLTSLSVTTQSQPELLVLDIGDGTKIELIKIKHGSFMMGASPSEKYAFEYEKPQHHVTLTHDFYLGKHVVTQEQYQAVMGANPSYFSGNGKGKGRVDGLNTQRFPVETVPWCDANEFCRKLSRLTGRDFDLPTEAEWEFACRAGSSTTFYFGDAEQDLRDYAWYAANSQQRTHDVGTRKPNRWGLYDMNGNVWQWCKDWYDQDYYSHSAKEDPPGPETGDNRVMRGGSWLAHARICRCASRGWEDPLQGNHNIGFRVVVRPK